MIDFSIIVVSYHSADDLPGLIASVDGAAAGAKWHVTIVNNAPDEPLAPLLAENNRVSIVEAGANLGYSGGLNLGRAHASRSRWTVFLNPDVTLHPGSLHALGAALDAATASGESHHRVRSGIRSRALRHRRPQR